MRDLQKTKFIEALQQENQRLKLENTTLCDFSVKLKRDMKEIKSQAQLDLNKVYCYFEQLKKSQGHMPKSSYNDSSIGGGEYAD